MDFEQTREKEVSQAGEQQHTNEHTHTHTHEHKHGDVTHDHPHTHVHSHEHTSLGGQTPGGDQAGADGKHQQSGHEHEHKPDDPSLGSHDHKH